MEQYLGNIHNPNTYHVFLEFSPTSALGGNESLAALGPSTLHMRVHLPCMEGVIQADGRGITGANDKSSTVLHGRYIAVLGSNTLTTIVKQCYHMVLSFLHQNLLHAVFDIGLSDTSSRQSQIG